jgi:hypothetical protein
MGILTKMLIISTKHIATLELLAIALEATARALEHIADICNKKERENETR